MALLIVASTGVHLDHEGSTQVVTITKPESEPDRGVRMTNEMRREDYDLIKGPGLPPIGPNIGAFYNAGKPRHDPEFAALTDRTIVYVKDGRATSFELADVVEVKGDHDYEESHGGNADQEVYHIEVRSKVGPRMRINIRPEDEGSAFFGALESAWNQATGPHEAVGH